jgi:LacI family transcriptional regulator
VLQALATPNRDPTILWRMAEGTRGGTDGRARTANGSGRVRSSRPTIFDVARVSGVSYSTVSRVVNGQPHIREETRRRVQQAMAGLGYVAHTSARTLASGRSQVVGLLAQELESSFFLGVIRGVDQQVSTAEYDFMLCTTHDRREKEAAYVARLSHGMVDGLLIILPRGLPDYVEQLRAVQFPFVLIDYDDDAPGCNVVNAANRPGTVAAIEHLVALGHRRIGFITGTLTVGSTHQRLGGYRDALLAAGIPLAAELVVPGDFLEPRGYEAARELLALADRPSAIFASSDAAAIGVLRAAREAGLRVPEDLSVVGFDDVPEASYVDPALTTVRQPLRDMGRSAVRRLMELLAEPDAPAQRIVVATELVVRGSTGPAPGTAAGAHG